MAQPDINYWAVLVSAVVSMIIGWLWFGLIFGKAWVKLMNIDMKKMEEMKKKGMAKPYIIMFIGLLLMNYVFAHFIDYADAATFNQGLVAGFWIWLGFFVPVMIGMVLWEGKPLKLYFIHVFHYLVVLLVSGAILAIWP